MLHRITMLVAGAMVGRSVFFVFRPLQPSRIQPPHPTLAATRCAAHPETSAIPAEYSCENHDPMWFPHYWTGGRLAIISPATKRMTSPYLPNCEKSNVDNDEQHLPLHRNHPFCPPPIPRPPS